MCLSTIAARCIPFSGRSSLATGKRCFPGFKDNLFAPGTCCGSSPPTDLLLVAKRISRCVAFTAVDKYTFFKGRSGYRSINLFVVPQKANYQFVTTADLNNHPSRNRCLNVRANAGRLIVFVVFNNKDPGKIISLYGFLGREIVDASFKG